MVTRTATSLSGTRAKAYVSSHLISVKMKCQVCVFKLCLCWFWQRLPWYMDTSVSIQHAAFTCKPNSKNNSKIFHWNSGIHSQDYTRCHITGDKTISHLHDFIYLFNLLKPTGHVMHHQFNIQQLYALHTAFMCFVFIWEQTATCATYSINWLVFITEIKSVYSAVRTGSLNKAVGASSVKG